MFKFYSQTVLAILILMFSCDKEPDFPETGSSIIKVLWK